MASVITLAFEGWKAQEAATGKPVLLNEFVFANVPNLDPTKPIDRNEKLPPANQIVHRQAVNKAGLVSENAVAYSVTLGADVGDFDFNWIGLLNKESGTVAMITHAPLQKKLKTQNGQQGNVLIRSFLLEFNGAAEETQIKTSAETWQIDFTARLTGMDEMQRLINVDNYGAAAFFNDGFEVMRSGEQFTVKKGLGYVGGLRGQLEQNQILNGLRNTKIYADFSYQGNIVSKWSTVIKITAAATLSDYVDAAGFTHQVFAIASIDASGNVKDLRPKGALSSQSISELEKKVNDGLGEKQDKGDYALRGESYTKTESNLKFQPAGNYAPSGDYATNTALKNGLDLKFDKKGGNVDGLVSAKNEVAVTTNNSMMSMKTLDSVRGPHFVSKIENGSYRTHDLQDSSGVLMHLGDYGWGGVGAREDLTEQQVENKFKTGVTQVWRNQSNSTKYAPQFAASIFAKAYDTFLNISMGHSNGNITATSGVSGNSADTFKIANLYSDLNTSTDRNGCLRTSTNHELSDYPVGSPIAWSQSSPPAGYLVCNGQSFNKTTYPLLAKAYPSGTLPDLRGEFIRGLDAGRNIDTGRAALSSQGDAIRNIVGTMHAHNALLPNSVNGAFSKVEDTTQYFGLANINTAQGNIEFNAGNVVPVANENRPRNIAFLYIVRAA